MKNIGQNLNAKEGVIKVYGKESWEKSIAPDQDRVRLEWI